MGPGCSRTPATAMRREDFVPSDRSSGINADMQASVGGRDFSVGLKANRMMVVAASLAALLLPRLLLAAETVEPVVFTQPAPAIGVYDFIEVTAAVRAPSVQTHGGRVSVR